jgi:putative redox protein
MTKIKIAYLGNLKTECIHEASGVRIETMPPRDLEPTGGAAFSPTDLLAASLGSCMLTLMAITARKSAIDLQGTVVEVEKEMSTSLPRRIARIIVRIRSPQTPIEPMRRKLEQAALECPVSHGLHPDIKKEVDFIWGLGTV